MHTPNVIKVAIEAAGGTSRVASELDLIPDTVRLWIRKHSMPDKHIMKVCQLGGDLITRNQVRDYMDSKRKA